MSLSFYIKVKIGGWKNYKTVPKHIDEFGAKCPNSKCDAKFVWDWCNDYYILWPKGCNAIEAQEIKVSEIKDAFGPAHLTHWYCNKCGTWLGKEVFRKIPNGAESTIVNNPKWRKIDWEDWRYANPHQ